MDFRYEEFCVADPVFYDTPAAPVAGTGWTTADRPLPAGWERGVRGDWLLIGAPTGGLPEQGWKVHVSAVPDQAEDVLAEVWDHCVPRGITFKFLHSRQVLKARNGKYADRAGSGKFVTIYPAGDAQLRQVLSGLGDRLEGRPGPYVLSDLRWRSGPLYVRYGGFRERLCRSESGALVPGIEQPDGRLVPDVRGPVFRLPAWVEPPDVLAPALAAHAATGAGDFPYEVVRALHFSNGGGVYLADDPRDGTSVLLKEARPYAGLDWAEDDAVTRLERERWSLETLAGLASIPRLVEHRTWWEHHFLVREYVEGESLGHACATRNPLLRPRPEPAELASYTDWALDVVDRLDRALTEVHGRGVVFGDLHPNNVLLRPDGSVALIDFEVAAPVDAPRRLTIGAPGYVAPPWYEGPQVDRYALGCLRMAVFVPLTATLRWDPGKVDQLLATIGERFPVPASFADAVRRDLGTRPFGEPSGTAALSWPDPRPAQWPRLRDALAGAILASATPERGDRLFPGDIEQFGRAGGLGLAYGAAGVLWALAETGAARSPDGERWLRDAARRPGHPGGLWDGLAGVAYALDRLGHAADARELLDSAAGLIDPGDPTLFSGAAGVGLVQLHLAGTSGDRTLLAAAGRTAEAVRSGSTRPPGRVGLMHGWSGPALLYLRLYAETGDSELLDAAGDALRRDVAGCVWTDEGTLQVDEGWRILPYLASGGAGIGMVLGEYLAYRPDPELERARAGITLAAESEFMVQSGLFNGRAGLILALLHADADPGVVHRHLASLGWHAVPYRGGLGFIGDQLMRLSTDLATGSAGVLLALAAALTDEPVGLPFLGAAPVRQPAGEGR